MAITKQTQIGKIEVVGQYKSVQVRTDTVVIEDGNELSRQYHRHSLTPDAIITDEHTEVQAVCNAVWTQDVKDAFEAFKTAQESELNAE